MIRRALPLVAVAALLGLLSRSARADFRGLVTPGPLAAPHAALDGKCDKCHVPFQGIPQANCLSCHEHTAAQVRSGKGFHGPLAKQKCSACHGDHKGRDFRLTPPIDPKTFDHKVTGVVLTGAHQPALCQSCHPDGGHGPKWAGIPTTCVGCHADTHHKGSLGPKCQQCHSSAAWVPPTRTAADHKVPMIGGHQGLICATCHKNGTHYVAKASCGDCHEQKHGGTKAACDTCHTPLDWKKATHAHDFCACILPGKHQTAPCLSCHPAYKFEPTPFECASCHKKDLKHEDLGACARCHSALSWKKKTFDHNKKVVGFPLEGMHLTVGCESCHTRPGIFKGAPTKCESCHLLTGPKAPKHGDFGPCAACHDTKGFTPARFSHDTTRFPLDGAHSPVACQTCHTRFAKGAFVPGPNACVLCHGDPHEGQFKAPRKAASPSLPAPSQARAHLAPDDGAHAVSPRWSCRDCHTGTSWKPSTIGLAEHAKFAFPLRAAHEKVACARCHTGGKFVGTPTACASCHTDAHGARFGTDCRRCHTETSFNEVVNFDHAAATGFALSGAHAKRACASCHGADRERLSKVARPITCATCHTAVHGAQFGKECTSCHQPTRFADVPPFAHAEKTGFPLERRHAAVKCLTCHDTARGARLDPACQSCHGDPHRGALGRECADCHKPDRWLLVRFDHDRSEFPLRGRHFVTPCADCHKNNQWTGLRTECVTCHAKDRPQNPNHMFRGWSCADCHSALGWHAH